MSIHFRGQLTLLDLVQLVQEITHSEQETVALVTWLLDSGRVRLRSFGDAHDAKKRRELPRPPMSPI